MVKPKRGLGKGLGALIVQEIIEVESSNIIEGSISEFEISKIFPNKNQPRKDFSSDKLNKLADSISQYGVVQAIVLRKIDDKFEIVAGERRWRASKIAGLKTIPAIIKELDDNELAEIALIENLQRENLNAIEEAIAYQFMINDHKLTQDKLSKLVGKSRTYITNILRLLKLDSDIQKMVCLCQISPAHGRTLLGIADSKKRIIIAKKVISDDISVRELEKIVRELKIKNNKKNSIVKAKNIKDPVISDFESHLKNFFGTKVSIDHDDNKGKIQINYYSDEELNRILELLEYTM